MVQYDVNILKNELHIKYYGKLFKSNSSEVTIVYGYTNEWKDTNKIKMMKIPEGFVATISLLGYQTINFCFANENGQWDNNNNSDYTVCIVEEKKDEIIEEPFSNGIKDCGLLLISEVQGKVFLPYTAHEIQDLIDSSDNEYETAEEVIENLYIKPFNLYKYQFFARFRETVELITKRENMSLKDGIDLALELSRKRYLHPAVISACKNLDELNVYLDCLDKNELDDFKVFNIKYEITPLVIKNENNLSIKKNIIQRFVEFLKQLFTKKEESK